MKTTYKTLTKSLLLSTAFTLGAGASSCGGTIENPDHCWNAKGDETCERWFGEGHYCSLADAGCPGKGKPYGCVHEQPEAHCYSPEGGQTNCFDNPGDSCEGSEAEVGDADGETVGTADGDESDDSDDMDDTSTEETEGGTPLCGNGVVEAGEECDPKESADGDGCTSACMLEGYPSSQKLFELHGSQVGPLDMSLDCTPGSNMAFAMVYNDDPWAYLIDLSADPIAITGSAQLEMASALISSNANMTAMTLKVGSDDVMYGFIGGELTNTPASVGYALDGDTLHSALIPQFAPSGISITNASTFRHDADKIGIYYIGNSSDNIYYTVKMDVQSTRDIDPGGNLEVVEDYEGSTIPGHVVAHQLPGGIKSWACGSGDHRLLAGLESGTLIERDYTSPFTCQDIIATQNLVAVLGVADNTNTNTDLYISAYSLENSTPLWGEQTDPIQIGQDNVQGANGLMATPGGYIVAAGFAKTGPSGEIRAMLSWLDNQGNALHNTDITPIMGGEGSVSSRLYDVDSCDDGDTGVAIGWRSSNGTKKLWVTKFELD